MDLAECHKRAAQLLMDLQRLGKDGVVLIPTETFGNYSVLTPATDMSELAAKFERIAESIYDGSGVCREVLKP
jgi:hypothetical protein